MIDKPNYTQIPNAILDDFIMCMGDAEFKVVMAIARQTFGYHRERHKMSISMLQSLTGLSRQGVINGIAAGMERGVIDREADGDGFVYALVIHETASQRNGLVHEIDQPASQRNGLVLVNEVDYPSQRSRPKLVNEVDRSTPILKKEKESSKEKTTKKEEGEAQAPTPPAVLRSRNAATNGKLRFESPHVNNQHFDPDTGYIRSGTGTTAVEIFYERFDVCHNEQRLTAPMEDDLVRFCPDLDKLRGVIIAYSRAGFKNQRNIQLILDWYQQGIPEKHRPPATGGDYPPGRSPNRGRNAVLDYMTQEGMLNGRH